ncbi:hypothetical protein CLV46_0812 [Diaminobutyricimonas aerilata]|uniref:Lon N-terminal domain-containing protein n=1 Tax=Diaminobutyricimonas aerilata TaxID=1162967 RepID=A0A2M9CHC3_9MICO|nr:LON peptidase substrate-binding domain-containing protein [Diaminobutyricimonas aerilata]PJJ71270.1 hypothetical protein CLV46_0812 [Diaminobutyricimonas aerilata]
MTELPVFPLGSVLLPNVPLALRIFEPRYLVMLAEVLQDQPPAFGVVLIERGQEVGGGDHRFTVGTVARIVELGEGDGTIELVATGTTRFQVNGWLDEDPYPRADVRMLPELPWQEEDRALLETAERTVRRALAVSSEFTEQRFPSDVVLAEDPAERAWQLAGVAPLGPLDQQRLLLATSIRELLTDLAETADGITTAYSSGWRED